jgi:tRNA dimethylallyltransferase
VTKKEMAGVPHHLLDVASPKKRFNVDDYKKRAEKACEQILKKNKMPIIVGGTGLYVDVLLGRITFPQVPPNPKLRAKLEKMSAEKLFVNAREARPSACAKYR